MSRRRITQAIVISNSSTIGISVFSCSSYATTPVWLIIPRRLLRSPPHDPRVRQPQEETHDHVPQQIKQIISLHASPSFLFGEWWYQSEFDRFAIQSKASWYQVVIWYLATAMIR
jgi:hypothetical protein